MDNGVLVSLKKTQFCKRDIPKINNFKLIN